MRAPQTDRDYLDDDEDWADELEKEGDKAFEEEEANDAKKKSSGASKKKNEVLDEFGLGGSSSFGKRNANHKVSTDGSDDDGGDKKQGSHSDDDLLDDDNDGIMDDDGLSTFQGMPLYLVADGISLV